MRPSSTSSSSPAVGNRAGLLAALVTLAALALGHAIPLEPLTGNVAGERVPYRVEVHELDPTWIAGVAARTRHAANGQGLRGDVIVGRDFEVLIVGGSTSECSLLDEADSLDASLARAVLERRGEDLGPVRVAAFAQPGLPLAGLLDELEIFSEDQRRPDVVVGLFGANEAQTFFNHAPWVRSSQTGPWEAWIDPASPFGVEGRADTYRGWYRPDNHGRFLEAPRAAYADPRGWQSSLHPGHVDSLRQALSDYVASLRALERLANSRGATLVLVTQPVAPWPPDQGRGWAPFIYAQHGAGFLPSPELTEQLVEAFNAQTRGFANERGLALVDLGAALDGCVECFYDQWHFTNEGASWAAEILAPVVVGR